MSPDDVLTVGAERSPDPLSSRRWHAPRGRAKRRRSIREDRGASVLEILAQLRDGTLPPEDPNAFP